MPFKACFKKQLEQQKPGQSGLLFSNLTYTPRTFKIAFIWLAALGILALFLSVFLAGLDKYKIYQNDWGKMLLMGPFLGFIGFFGASLSGASFHENLGRRKVAEKVYVMAVLRNFDETKFYFIAQTLNLFFLSLFAYAVFCSVAWFLK